MSKATSTLQKHADEFTFLKLDHIPAIARMCHRIGLIDIINENLPCKTNVDPGTLVLGMVCDTLSGRSPLYKVEEFIAEQDSELLFGTPVSSRSFNDDALGDLLDRIHKKGTLKLFTEVSLKAAQVFELDSSKCNFDTTSVNVWGAYANSSPKASAPHITHGYSKDKRPDLKQFMVSMLCVEGNIPLSGKMQDGNSSDEKLNNEELQRIGKLLKPLRKNIKDLVYVADSKLINGPNMPALQQLKFISRLPATFKGHKHVIEEALEADNWENLGVLAQTPSPSRMRQRANYLGKETQVSIAGKNYRAIVIQTDHLDKRRTRGIERTRNNEKKQIEKKIKAAQKTTYHCQLDAQKALEEITQQKPKSYWNITGSIKETPVYAPGRAPRNGERKIKGSKYTLELSPEENTTYYQQKLRTAGCFVMITNTTKAKMPASEVLRTYKEQYGVEQNFSFLKEPLIANDTFLKNPSRIDALTLILLISLMIWNLIQRELRRSKEAHNNLLENLNKRPTQRPTGYLFMSQLSGTKIIKQGNLRVIPRDGIKPQGILYLKALGFDVSIYTSPPKPRKTQRYT